MTESIFERPRYSTKWKCAFPWKQSPPAAGRGGNGPLSPRSLLARLHGPTTTARRRSLKIFPWSAAASSLTHKALP